MRRHIRTEVAVEASAERVWQVLADLPAYGQWNPLIRDASGALAAGGELSLHIAAPGLAERRVPVKLLAVEPGRELRWLGRFVLPGLLDGDHRFVLTPQGPGRVHVVQEERFAGLLVPFVAPVLVPKMTAAFEALNAALRLRAERPV